MSAELSESLDPRQVANLMAGHLARAMGVDECAISYWDRPAGRVESLGYYPRAEDRRTMRAVLRRLAATRRRCASSSARRRSSSTPTTRRPTRPRSSSCDATGNRVLAMLPLVAKGQSIGLVELFSQIGDHLGRRAPRARPDDGQRGRDGARERPALRGRAQPRRPRPADRLLQPPVPARAPGRGGRPRPARPAAA